MMENTFATGVYIEISLPNGLILLSYEELIEYRDTGNSYLNVIYYHIWLRSFEKTKDVELKEDKNKFIVYNELTKEENIVYLLNAAYIDEYSEFSHTKISNYNKEIKHKLCDFISGVSILATKRGKFIIKCKMICDEFV